MTDVADPLPFTRKRGVLYMAPLGTELPNDSVEGGRFALAWPAAWIRVDPAEMTAPTTCSATHSAELLAAEAVWDFGPRARVRLQNGWGRTRTRALPRFMLGWQSEDAKDRLVAKQVVADDVGRCHLEWTQEGEMMSLFTWHRARTTEEHNAEVGS